MSSAATGASTQFLDVDPSSLCTTGKNPLNLTGIILWVLRRHFSKESYIQNASLQGYIWAAQPANTNAQVSGSDILIESVEKVAGQPEQYVQQRPALLVKRNRLAPTKLGFGDRYMRASQPGLDCRRSCKDYALDTDDRYEVLLVGSHTVFCVAGTGGEAEALGTESFFELVEFTQLIRKDMDLSRFQIQELGAVAKLEESKEHFVVPIVAMYSYFHTWHLKLEAPEMKGFGLSVS
jgi:hypothetical protein